MTTCCQDSLLVYLSILHLDRKCQKVWNVKWGRFLQVSVNVTIKKLSYLFLGNGAEFLMSQVVDQENDPVWVVMVWYFHSTGSRKQSSWANIVFPVYKTKSALPNMIFFLIHIHQRCSVKWQLNLLDWT